MNPIHQRIIAASASRPAITLVGTTQTDPGSTNVSSLNLAVPSGVLNNDLLIAVVTGHSNLVTDWVQTSFTWAAEQNNSSPNLSVAYRIASSEPSSYSFTVSTQRQLGGFMLAYRNALWDTNSAISTTLTAASITVGFSRSTILSCAARDTNSASYTAPAGMTTLVSSLTANRCNFAIASQSNVAAGSTGSKVHTLGSNGNTASVLLSIKPA
jgi:hypothetical protein